MHVHVVRGTCMYRVQCNVVHKLYIYKLYVVHVHTYMCTHTLMYIICGHIYTYVLCNVCIYICGHIYMCQVHVYNNMYVHVVHMYQVKTISGRYEEVVLFENAKKNQNRTKNRTY